MALLQKGVAAATHRMPKVFSPGGHAVADYINAGLFGLMAIVFWNRNRRAALASLAAGVAEAGTSLMTDYPGGISDSIDFPTHGKIDMGLAAATFAMPSVMRFDDDPEAKFFRIMSLTITAVTGLTDFEATGVERQHRRAA